MDEVLVIVLVFGISWNAMLKMTEIELELISDNDLHWQKGMRWVIS